MVVHKKVKESYQEYIKWYDNLGINREYLREVKIKSLTEFAQRIINDYELWYMFGEDCTVPLSLLERQEIFKERHPSSWDILSHKHYDDFLIPTVKLIK